MDSKLCADVDEFNPQKPTNIPQQYMYIPQQSTYIPQQSMYIPQQSPGIPGQFTTKQDSVTPLCSPLSANVPTFIPSSWLQTTVPSQSDQGSQWSQKTAVENDDRNCCNERQSKKKMVKRNEKRLSKLSRGDVNLPKTASSPDTSEKKHVKTTVKDCETISCNAELHHNSYELDFPAVISSKVEETSIKSREMCSRESVAKPTSSASPCSSNQSYKTALTKQNVPCHNEISYTTKTQQRTWLKNNEVQQTRTAQHKQKCSEKTHDVCPSEKLVKTQQINSTIQKKHTTKTNAWNVRVLPKTNQKDIKDTAVKHEDMVVDNRQLKQRQVKDVALLSDDRPMSTVSKTQRNQCSFNAGEKDVKTSDSQLINGSQSRENSMKTFQNNAGMETKINQSISYSDMLKKPRQLEEKLPAKDDRRQQGILVVTKEQLEEEGTEVESGKKKKKKKKKKSGVVQPQAVKKTKTAIMFDFGEMFEKLESVGSSKKVIRAGGLLPVQAPIPKKQADKKHSETKVTSANSLDSTAPIVYRKKERETPKKKKPSAMRKILTKEREERRLTREENSIEKDEVSDGAEENINEGDEISETEPSCEEILKTIHSRKFREYCNHDLDYDINGAVIALLKELLRFQDRLFQKDPVKAKARRRFVCGLKEVTKHVKLKKIKCVIVTPNLEPTKSKGGITDLLCSIIDECNSQNVPVVFALNRQVLGKVLLKKVPVSIVGIFYYDGAQNHFKMMLSLTEVARQTYQDKYLKAKETFKIKDIEQSTVSEMQ